MCAVPTESRPERRVNPAQRAAVPPRAPSYRPPPPPPQRVITRIEIPNRTIFHLLIVFGVLWFLWQIRGILLQLFVACIVAAALYPLVRWLQGRGVPRSAAVLLSLVGFLAVLGGLIFLIAEPLVEQTRSFIDNLPTYVEDFQGLVENNDLYQRFIDQADEGSADPSTVIDPVVTAGQRIFSGISATFFVIIMAIYILLEGKRVMRWLTRDLPDRQRARLERLIPELVHVVSGYVFGQSIVSLAVGVYSFILLTILDVPEPLLLAVVTAFLSVIPIVGIFISTALATLVAFTVSVPVALIVLAAYVIYQQIENYVIVPRVYQGTLQISSFAVLIAVLIGTTLLGPLGAILALPVAAAIPVIERVWLNEEMPELVAGVAAAATDEDEQATRPGDDRGTNGAVVASAPATPAGAAPTRSDAPTKPSPKARGGRGSGRRRR